MNLPANEPVLECVPNFSEGRDTAVIEAIAAAIRAVPGQHLLHVDSSAAANRTVLTFAGAPEAVGEAAFQAIKTAAALIDMRRQDGVHPRIGATDVCPLVPLAHMTMEEADFVAQSLGRRIGSELGIPVYLYEHSQKAAYRRSLPSIRKGQYEGFAEKMKMPEWAPDFGPGEFVPAAGATVLGARDLLVAFNISLDTADVAIAHKIAALLRSSGTFRLEQGKKIKQPGLLPKTRAIGWYMADYEQAQVSFNLLDYRVTSPLTAFEACRKLAAQEGVGIAGSELIGLMPADCLLEAGSFFFLSKEQAVPEDTPLLMEAGIEYLMLDKLKPFAVQEKILELAYQSANPPVS